MSLQQYHDVGSLLLEHRERLKEIPVEEIRRMAKISKRLRKERELAFYGEIVFIPTEEYTKENARSVIRDAQFVVERARKLIR